MPRISLSQVQQLPDMLSNEHFTFDLGTLPGSQSNANLVIKCMDAVISGFGNQAFQVQLAGYVRQFRGMKTYGGERSITVTFAEDVLMHTFQALRSWHEQIVGTASGTSIGGVKAYSINQVYLTIYDQAGNTVDIITFYNVFIADVPDVQVTGSEQSQLMRVSVSFKFDYYISSLAAPQ